MKYFFFPAIVNVECPQHMCQPHKSIAFECGWFYMCGQKIEQVTTRFLHVLILRLAFACNLTSDPQKLSEWSCSALFGRLMMARKQ